MTSIGDIARVRILQTVLGQEVVNDFGFVALDGVDDLAALAADVRSHFAINTGTGLAAGRVTGMSITAVAAADVKPGTSATAVNATALPVAGTATGDPLPPQCAVVVTWNTGLKGRAYRGRTYLTGWSETQQSGGVWGSNVGPGNLVDLWVADWLTRYGPGGAYTHWQFGIISAYLNNVRRATPVCTPVTGAVIRPYVQTQRRRAI